MGKDAKSGGKGKGKQASGSDDAAASKGKGKSGKAADGLGTCTYVKGVFFFISFLSLILVFLYAVIIHT